MKTLLAQLYFLPLLCFASNLYGNMVIGNNCSMIKSQGQFNIELNAQNNSLHKEINFIPSIMYQPDTYLSKFGFAK